jgi:hypothetical protein
MWLAGKREHHMNFKDFVARRWVQQYQHRSFSPALVNQEWTWNDPVINTLLEQATQAIGVVM